MPGSRRRLLNRAETRARQLLSELPALPEPWDVHAFVERVAEHRRRRISCAPTTMSQYASVASGLWVRQPDFDLIAYDATASALHQENTILHELGHILLGHQGVSLPDPRASGAAAQARTGERAEAVHACAHELVGSSPDAAVMRRDYYDAPAELEAETWAYEVWRAAGTRLVDMASSADRMAAAFEHGSTPVQRGNAAFGRGSAAVEREDPEFERGEATSEHGGDRA